MQEISQLLAMDETSEAQLAHLQDIGPPGFEVVLPTAEEAAIELLRLAVPHEDIDAVTACIPAVRQSAPLWWLLERCVHSLVQCIGSVQAPPRFPAFADRELALHRYFPILVFLVVLPRTRQHHRDHGVPQEISWHTLTDLGRHVAIHRRFHGTGGLRGPQWLFHHFRGMLYQLGRLQFQPGRLNDKQGEALTTAGLPYAPGDPCLYVHIPDFFGPLSPAACDAAFAQAKEFFARHYPQERYDVAVCGSWLLDDQLGEYLPPDSNIVRFQRRFTLAYASEGSDESDENIVRFVYGRDSFQLAELPRRTSLERAITDHLKAGRHWRSGTGFLLL